MSASADPRSIVITGASSGIGAALARAYAAPGRVLGLTGRDAARLADTVAAARTAGAEVVEGLFDVRETAALTAWLQAFDEAHPVDLLVSNAGVVTGLQAGRSAEVTESAFRLVDVNLKGAIATVSALVERMRARRRGHIVLVSSLAGLYAHPDLPSYSASKAAVRFYGDALRQWLKGSVEVTVVCPGFVTSPMSSRHIGPKPFEISADKAAGLIRRGIARRKALIAFPWPLVLPIWFANLVPARVADFFMGGFAAEIEPDAETARERAGGTGAP